MRRKNYFHFNTQFKTNDAGVLGVTVIELMWCITIVAILFAVTVVLIKPVETLRRGRDDKRISDISMLDRVITEYRVDEGNYPDTVNTLRKSTDLPIGSTDLTNIKTGWIKQNLSAYASRLPIDPYNNETYYYSYYHTADAYELDAKLEYNLNLMTSDGGDDSTVYEVGNNLTLISP